MSFRTVCHKAPSSCFELVAKRRSTSTTKSLVAAVARNEGTGLPNVRSTSGTFRFKSIASENSTIHSSRNATAHATANANSSKQATSSSSNTSSHTSKAQTTSTATPLIQTALAAVAGITTVSIAASIVESTTASSVPPFDPSNQRFDQSTFIGRFSKMILACDPLLLTYSDEETRRAKEMVRNYKYLLANLPENVPSQQEMNHSLWEALRISSSSLHPDTGDVIPQPFRMSGYVPYNGPICVAMVASTSTPTLLFWSFVNQSQNALVNYFNRNASSEMDNGTLMKSYSAAVVSALTVAFGLATFIQK